MEFNTNLVSLKHLEIISAMIHLMEYRKNGPAYGKLDGLFDEIPLIIEDGTKMLI